jgi:hypothetical protein
MKSRRRWIVGGAVGAALVLAAGVAAVGAQSGDDDGNGTSFLDRVAAKLGIDTPRLEQAIDDARNDQINEAVENGDLTEEQAERLRERLEELPGDAPFGGMFGGHGGGFGFKFRHGPGGDFKFDFFAPGLHLGQSREELATFLGITTDELAEEMRADGATLATVAEAHGKSRDDLKAFIRGEAESALNDAVDNGILTRERADALLQRLGEHVDRLIDGQWGMGRFHFRFGRDDDDADRERDDEPQEQRGREPALPGA